jgi:hypothetical protein
MQLQKSMWQGGGYYYLNKSDSDLYDKVKDSQDEKDLIIKQMLLDKAASSRASRCASRY